MPYYAPTPVFGASSAAEALRALLAQRPKPEVEEDLNTPAPPSAPATLRPVERPEPPQIPQYGSQAQNVVPGEFSMPESPFQNVSRENAAKGLAGLQAAQHEQFSPFGELELHRLATRDPNMVAPGSNVLWAGKLKESQDRHAGMEAMQQKALEGISGAISGTHPAVQFQAEQEARRKAMPAAITAQGQFRAAQEAANARRDVGEANLEGRVRMSQHNTLDTVMNAIRAIRAKSGGLTSGDAVQLRALENLYDLLSEPLTGATFDEATEGFEE